MDGGTGDRLLIFRRVDIQNRDSEIGSSTSHLPRLVLSGSDSQTIRSLSPILPAGG